LPSLGISHFASVLGGVQAAPASPVLARCAREQPGHRLRALARGGRLAQAGGRRAIMALIVASLLAMLWKLTRG
jgi:hypothetical protein